MVPVIVPVFGSKDKPAGRPVTLNEIGPFNLLVAVMEPLRPCPSYPCVCAVNGESIVISLRINHPKSYCA